MTTDLTSRAMAAYFRSASQTGELPAHPSTTEEIEIDSLRYVVLSNTDAILAVYRVRIVNDQPMLKGMKRWPKEINSRFNR